MNTSAPIERSQQQLHHDDTPSVNDHQLSPASTSLSFPETSASEVAYLGPQDQRDDAISTRAEALPASKIKKKLSELDIRGAMGDLDIRKGWKRHGIEDFYIQLDEPHRIFWCPGDFIKGQVHLTLEKPVKTQFVIVKLTGLLSVSMSREKAEHVIHDDELVLWGNKIHTQTVDRTTSPQTEYDSPKKQKGGWDTAMMDEGEHFLPFEFDLPPKSMPSSIDFGKGSITYTIRCVLQRPSTLFGMRNKSVAQRDIPILDVLDVSTVPVPEAIRIRQPDHSKRGKTTGEIRTDVELHKAGYLKGDQIRLNIKIRHTKPMKNLKGAIVTLYRMTRFDSPRGEPSTFRKDLAQTIAPVICDPRTLECNISPRIRIPPDTFPTIRSVQFLSFRYYLEVILDLSPKTSVFQTFSTPSDYDTPEEIKASPSNFIDTVILLKKSKPFLQTCQFEIVVGTIDAAAKDLDLQLQRQQQLLHNHPRAAAKRNPPGTFPSAPDLPRLRDSATSTTSSISSFTHNPPPPPFFRGSSSPTGITLAGGPSPRSHSAGSRASISKTAFQQRESALLPSAPPETTTSDNDASAPPITLDNENPLEMSNAPQIHISQSHESLTTFGIEIPKIDCQSSVNDDEQYLASLQSRVSAPSSSTRTPSDTRIPRRPVSREIESEEASAPPLDDTAEDNVSISERTSFASTLPLYTPRG